MPKNPGLIIKKMTLKERVKATLLLSSIIFMLTISLIFFTNTSGATLADIIKSADAVNYSWRDLFIVLYFPVLGYFDMLLLSLLFAPLSSNLSQLLFKLLNIVLKYIAIVFLITLPLSLYVSFYYLSDYESCDLKGPFSSTRYVKDLKMCEQFEYHPETDKSDDKSILVTPVETKNDHIR